MPAKKFWLCRVVVAVVMCVAMVPATSAGTIAYDSGQKGYGITDGYGPYFAVRFTNDTLEPIDISHFVYFNEHGPAQVLDVLFWDVSFDGSPGSQLAILPDVSTDSDDWQRFDVQNLSLTIPAGGEIFAGMHPKRIGGVMSWVQYDNDDIGTGRSWWIDDNQPGVWLNSGVWGIDNNLMFRLETVPEPSTLSLLALGSLSLIRRRR